YDGRTSTDKKLGNHLVYPHFPLRRFLSLYRTIRVCRFRRSGSKLAAKRLSLLLFYIGWNAWSPHLRRTLVDGCDDVSHCLASINRAQRFQNLPHGPFLALPGL